MAKRTASEWERKPGVENSQAERIIEVDVPPAGSARLVLLQDVHLKYRGPVTGTEYVFDGAGSVVEVSTLDAEVMILKKTGAGCCGTPPAKYFAYVGGE